MTHGTSAGEASELKWLKSSYSDSSNPSDCVEVAHTPATVLIRDSKEPGGAQLMVAPGAWVAFVRFAARR
ncbi:DUF397 domain-containing protein [Streptomyces populi]|uniref:DUF397 domain-containing protein n=1 Tax=Streptomyces populi TaxID=2058924 RepID=A0A2I0SSU9_9ACTN|nr:DUF397 domain-containing protein [Streptomyces populi]PKT72998.1 DUF397 domain-containing protein [Streptomyces populi]